MKIQDAVHALILFDQKKLIPRKTLLKTSVGTIYKFIRVDTQLNWPRIVVEDSKGNQLLLDSKVCRTSGLTAEDPGIFVEAFEAPP